MCLYIALAHGCSTMIGNIAGVKEGSTPQTSNVQTCSTLSSIPCHISCPAMPSQLMTFLSMRRSYPPPPPESMPTPGRSQNRSFVAAAPTPLTSHETLTTSRISKHYFPITSHIRKCRHRLLAQSGLLLTPSSPSALLFTAQVPCSCCG